MARKKPFFKRPGDFAEGKAMLEDRIALEGALDTGSGMEERYTDSAPDDLDRSANVRALVRELGEAIRPRGRATASRVRKIRKSHKSARKPRAGKGARGAKRAMRKHAGKRR